MGWRVDQTGMFTAAALLFACGGDGLGSSGGESDATLATAESSNPLPTLVINEVVCDGGDLVEIVNLGDDAIDVSAVFATDDLAGPNRAGFSPTTIAPGGFAVAALGQFGIKCANEPAIVVQDDEIVDEVTAPTPEGIGQGWGRIPDGDGPWVATTPTPGAANQAAGPVADLFDIDVIRDIEVELGPESIAGIESQVAATFCDHADRDYFSGSVTIDGERFEGVGVRVRGNATAESLYGKPSLKLDFAWDDPAVEGCASPREVLGQRKLNLLNMRQDPSFIRIPLASELYRSVGVPQPRASYARLTINGEYTGIVVMSQNIDRKFLGKWFPSNDGMMYEAACFCDVSTVTQPVDEASTCFARDFSVDACDEPNPEHDPTDWSQLEQFAAELAGLSSGFYPEVEQFFDFDGFLTLWAATMFLGSGDGYFLNQNSYRIYHDPSAGTFAMIDHGSADGIMRTFADQCVDDVLQLGEPTNLFGSTSTLPLRCQAEPDCLAAYAARVWEIHDAFTEFGLGQRAQELHDLIIEEMRADPRYYYNGCGVLYEWADIEAHFGDYVLPWIAVRFDDVAAQLAAAGFPR